MGTVGKTWFYAVCALAMAAFMVIGCKDTEIEGPDIQDEEMCEKIEGLFTDLESYLEDRFNSDYSNKGAVMGAVKEWIEDVDFISGIAAEGDSCIVVTFSDGHQSSIEYSVAEETSSDADYQYPEDQLQDIPEFIGPSESPETKASSTSDYPLFNNLFIVLWEPFQNEGISDDVIIDYFMGMKNVYAKTYYTYKNTDCTLGSLHGIGGPYSWKNRTIYPSVIIIATHGRRGYCMETVYNSDDYITLHNWWKKKHAEFPDWKIRSLVITGSQNRISHRLKIPYGYLVENLGTINNSMVFLNNCESMPDNNLGLYRAFEKNGASAVFGYQYPVDNFTCHANTYSILSYMLHPPKNPQQPVNSAFFAYYYNISAKCKQNFKFHGSTGNAVRFANKVYTRKYTKTKSETGMGALHLDYCDPTAGYDKVLCGLVYADNKQDLYLDSEGKAGFVSTEVDHFIEEGEDFFFSLDNLKPDTEYFYRAFLAVRYPEGILIHYADEIESYQTEPGDYIDIPDPEFKRYLTSERLYTYSGPDEESMTNGHWWDYTDEYIDADRDGEISVSEAERIEFIQVHIMGDNDHYYDIHSLKGIESMPNLVYLCCNGDYGTGFKNAIDYVDLSGNPSLKYLNLDNTGIIALNTSCCTDLRELDCRDNARLEKIEVQGSVALESITCSNCPNLASLDVKGMSNLKSLDCGRCNLKALDLSGCKSLNTSGAVSNAMNWGNNPISYLNVSDTEIDHNGINISGPCADTLTIVGGASLNEFSISDNPYGNNTSHLYFPDCPALKSVDCSSPYIKEVNVSGAGEGVNLNISNCSPELKIVGGNALKQFTLYWYDAEGLTNLDMSECAGLKELSCLDLSELRALDISGCDQLTYFIGAGLKLTSLDFTHCKSFDYVWVRDCLSLETILLPPGGAVLNYGDTTWGEWHYSHTEGETVYGTYFPMIYVDGVLFTYPIHQYKPK